MREYKNMPTMGRFEVKRTCNKCGMEYNTENCEEEWQWDTMHSINLSFTYGSNHDLENWHFDLCEHCIEEIVKDFKFAPTVEMLYVK